jgi:uncharacterized membrane protein
MVIGSANPPDKKLLDITFITIESLMGLLTTVVVSSSLLQEIRALMSAIPIIYLYFILLI